MRREGLAAECSVPRVRSPLEQFIPAEQGLVVEEATGESVPPEEG